MTTKEMNAEILRQAQPYLAMFPTALKLALNERDRAKVAELALAAHRFAENTTAYIDQCEPQELDPQILTLAEDLQTGETVIWGALKDLLLALEDEDDGESWKETV